ncbi:MAG: hypothetical protein ACPW61_12170 [Methyloligella sp. ZOD6]
MTRRGFKIGFRLLLAFLTWLSLAPASANAVLCIGLDGHVAVETAHLVSCHDAESVHHDPEAHKGVALAMHGQDHAGPCLDLTSPPGAAATKAMAQLDAPAKSTLAIPATGGAAVRAKTLAAPPPPATAPPSLSPHLALLKTVVLRN